MQSSLERLSLNLTLVRFLTGSPTSASFRVLEVRVDSKSARSGLLLLEYTTPPTG